MPLNQRVSFKRPLEKTGKVQVPKIIRWQFKMEPQQVLKVGLAGTGGWEYFYAKMEKDGRIRIPKTELFDAFGKVDNLAGCLVEVTVEPA